MPNDTRSGLKISGNRSYGALMKQCVIILVQGVFTMCLFAQHFVFQASELASIIQRRRDLGCLALQVVHLEEGLNSDSSVAADFWSLLGGRTQYRGERSKCVYSLYTSIISYSYNIDTVNV